MRRGSERPACHTASKVGGPSIHHALSRVRLFATPWTVSHQAPLSMGFSTQEYWSGLPFPSPLVVDKGYYNC